MDIDYRVFALGDSAVVFDLGPVVSRAANRRVRNMRLWLKAQQISGLHDLIVGYSSLCLTYDPVLIRRHFKSTGSAYEAAAGLLLDAFRQGAEQEGTGSSKHLYIPVVYGEEFGPDLSIVSGKLGISETEIIQIHSGAKYEVFMTGFVPGFSYLVGLDKRLGIERKPDAVPVPAGSVGIAGFQTGVYPINCSGGWQLIGRTPFRLFTGEDTNPVMLEPGDQVSFYPISREEWNASGK